MIEVRITEEHIKEELGCMGLKTENMGMLIGYLRAKINDEADESGATYLCLFVQKLLNLAYEDSILEESEITN